MIIDCLAGGNERPGSHIRLDDEHPAGHPADQAVAPGKVFGTRFSAHGILAHDGAATVAGDLQEKLGVFRRIRYINSAAQNRDCTTIQGLQCATMGGGVDASRPARHHAHAGPGEQRPEPLSLLSPVNAALATTNNRHRV